jgi:ketopantoate reductase
MGPKLISGYTKFAVVGAGAIGNYIVQELLKDKAAVLGLSRRSPFLPAR